MTSAVRCSMGLLLVGVVGVALQLNATTLYVDANNVNDDNDDSGKTVVDGGGTNRGFSTYGLKLTNSVVRGFTFLNGSQDSQTFRFSERARAAFCAQAETLSEAKTKLSPALQKVDSAQWMKKRGGTPLLMQSAKIDLIDCDIRCRVSDRLVEVIRKIDGVVISRSDRYGSIHAKLPSSSVELLAADVDVKSINPVLKPLFHAATCSEGVIAHKVNVARTDYGVTGAGVKVGVISDSCRYLADLQATGDLPQNVTVLPGKSGVLEGGDDAGEGTGMMEIIHDVAPGALLYFSDSGMTQAEMADNILALADAGCRIIVDDVGYHAEAPFQDDVIAQAVNTVADSGVLYFSCAANNGNLDAGTSSCWEGDYVCANTDGTGGGAGHGVCAFGELDYNPILSVDSDTTIVVLNWSDPLGGSSNDYDLYLVDLDSGDVIAQSLNVQNGQGYPLEILSFTSEQFRTHRLALVVKNCWQYADRRYLRLNAFGARLGVATAGSTYGHNAAGRAITCAAVSAAGRSRPFGASDAIELFSSDGPRRIFYSATGAALTAGEPLSSAGLLLSKPEIAAADDTASSWVEVRKGRGTFRGTSASAPHAAAIAALMLDANPSLWRDDIVQIFKQATFSGANGTWDRNSGYGALNAEECVRLAVASVGRTKMPERLAAMRHVNPAAIELIWRHPDVNVMFHVYKNICDEMPSEPFRTLTGEGGDVSLLDTDVRPGEVYYYWVVAKVGDCIPSSSASVSFRHVANTWYVDQKTGNDGNDGQTKLTALASIQQAIDMADEGDTILVDDGVYDGFQSANKLLSIISVNGVDRTVIDARGVKQCADMGSGSASEVITNTYLGEFTIRNGFADYSGGGVCFGTVENCVVSNCMAFSNGAGSFGGVRRNCIFVGNKADGYGGGAYGGMFDHCVFYTNSAALGGGLHGGTIQTGSAINCIFLDNFSERDGGDDAYDAHVSYSCGRSFLPNFDGNVGNISCDPKFTDPTNGLFRLADDSPCINAGVPNRIEYYSMKDFDGNLRIRDGRTDMGPYELDVPGIVGLDVVAAEGGWVTPMSALVNEGEILSLRAGGPRPFLGFKTNGVFATSDRVFVLTNLHEDCVLEAEFQTGPCMIYANPDENVGEFANGNSFDDPMRLQQAIDIALPGDTIVAADGVYKPIETGGKAVTIRSVNGMGASIIDGGNESRCVTLGRSNSSMLASSDTELVGFTLRNGRAPEDDSYGGGAEYGRLTNCRLINNSARYGGGASDAILKNCEIISNVAGSHGGGIYRGEAEGCIFRGNRATEGNGGGAIDAPLTDCTLEENVAANMGGGASFPTGVSAIRCILRNNVANLGGGVDSGICINCLIQGNTANRSGGGCYTSSMGGGLSLVNCTVAGNVANIDGGGIYCENTSCECCAVGNSILWGNTLASGMISNYSYISPRYGILFKSTCSSPLPNGTGCIDADPQFVSSTNFRLTKNSPCVDSAVVRVDLIRLERDIWSSRTIAIRSSLSIDENSLDLVKNNRRFLNGIDMGAYECQEVPDALRYPMTWGSWSIEHDDDFEFPTEFSDWESVSRFVWRARDKFFTSSQIGVLPPSNKPILTSLGTFPFSGSVSAVSGDEEPVQDIEYGVPVWHVRIVEDTVAGRIVATIGGVEVSGISAPAYNKDWWVEAVYGTPPTWLDAAGREKWYAERRRTRIESFMTLVPSTRYDEYLENVAQDENVVRPEDRDKTLIRAFLPNASTDFLHLLNVRTPTDAIVNVFGSSDLANTNWDFNGIGALAQGRSSIGVTSDESAHFFKLVPGGIDSDGDGISDVLETMVYGTNPMKVDSTGSGLTDREKIYRYDLNPTLRDTDGDGYDDDEEIVLGQDPKTVTPGAATTIRYVYDDDDRLTGTYFGNNGRSTTKLSPAGNPLVIEKRGAK